MIGNKLINLETVSSTNDFAERLLRENDPIEGTVIQTKFQTKGRGEGGTQWESQADKNLIFSIILKPSFLLPEHQFYLSKVIALGITKFLQMYTEEVSIKWPNDLYVKDDKIAGILIENSFSGNNLTYTIAGVGINLNQTNFPDHLPNPVSLKEITGYELEINAALETVCESIGTFYSLLKAGNKLMLDSLYKNALYKQGVFTIFKTLGKQFEGKILDVEDTGELIIEKRDASRSSFRFKEISYV